MLNKIEALREDINNMIITTDYDKEELLQKSQELDVYISRFMEENLPKEILKNKNI